MHTIHGLTLGCLLSALMALSSPGQEGLKNKAVLDDVIARHYKAIGGIDAHRRHKTRKMEGSINMGMGDWKMTILQKALNLKLTRIDIGDGGQVLEGYDGKVAWKLDPGQAARKLEGVEHEKAAREAAFYAPVEMKKLYEPLTYDKQVKNDGILYHVLKGRIEGNQVITFFLNAENYLIERMTMSLPIAEQDLTVKLSDYKGFDGIQLPCSIVITMPVGKEKPFSMTLNINSVTHGVDVDDAVFAMPGDGRRR
jgi:hypothetical protein